MTTKELNLEMMDKAAGGRSAEKVKRWDEIYLPWFKVGDRVKFSKYPGRIFIVTAQGKHSNDERLELYWYNLVDANKPGFTLNGVGQSQLSIPS